MSIRHILLVDDDKDDQFFFCDILKEIDADSTCQVADNGLEAILYLSGVTRMPDIIFLDLNMPFMNGFECLHELKKKEQWKQIPVVIFTTSSNPYDVEKTMEMGASGFFTKPADYLLFKEKLKEVLKTDF